MANKKNSKKRNNGITAQQIIIPEGTLTESFKKFIEKDSSVPNILQFLSCKNAQLLLKCSSLENFSKEDRQELYDFYDFFMENYGDKTYNARIRNWGQEPLIFRLTEALYDDDCEKKDEEFMKNLSPDILSEAQLLLDKVMPIRRDRRFSCITANDCWEFWMTKTIPKKYLQSTKDYSILSFAKIIACNGAMVVRIIESDGKPSLFGITAENGKWIPLTKEQMEKVDKKSQNDTGDYEEVNYIELTR